MQCAVLWALASNHSSNNNNFVFEVEMPRHGLLRVAPKTILFQSSYCKTAARCGGVGLEWTGRRCCGWCTRPRTYCRPRQAALAALAAPTRRSPSQTLNSFLALLLIRLKVDWVGATKRVFRRGRRPTARVPSRARFVFAASKMLARE